MKITHFFVILLALSFTLFVVLKPEKLKDIKYKETASLEIEDFIVYELDKEGVASVVNGTLGQQFKTHYDIQNAHYIKNKKPYSEHLYADLGSFKDEIAYLSDNVRYFREDGLSLESDNAVYNTKKENLYIPGSFVLSQNENIVYGKELHYDSKTGKIKAKKIDANYYIEDKK